MSVSSVSGSHSSLVDGHVSDGSGSVHDSQLLPLKRKRVPKAFSSESDDDSVAPARVRSRHGVSKRSVRSDGVSKGMSDSQGASGKEARPRRGRGKALLGLMVMVTNGRFKGEVGYVDRGANGYYHVRFTRPQPGLQQTENACMKRSGDLVAISTKGHALPPEAIQHNKKQKLAAAKQRISVSPSPSPSPSDSASHSQSDASDSYSDYSRSPSPSPSRSRSPSPAPSNDSYGSASESNSESDYSSYSSDEDDARSYRRSHSKGVQRDTRHHHSPSPVSSHTVYRTAHIHPHHHHHHSAYHKPAHYHTTSVTSMDDKMYPQHGDAPHHDVDLGGEEYQITSYMPDSEGPFYYTIVPTPNRTPQASVAASEVDDDTVTTTPRLQPLHHTTKLAASPPTSPPQQTPLITQHVIDSSAQSPLFLGQPATGAHIPASPLTAPALSSHATVSTPIKKEFDMVSPSSAARLLINLINPDHDRI